MSVLTAIAALLAIVPKAEPEPERDDRIAELERRIEVLEMERDRALDGVEALQTALLRMSERIGALERARPDRSLNQVYAAMQAQQAMQQQGMGQQAMGMPNPAQQASLAQQAAMYAEMRNAWAEANGYAHICNCVPARHDMFMMRGR